MWPSSHNSLERTVASHPPERRRRGTHKGSKALTCFWQAVLQFVTRRSDTTDA